MATENLLDEQFQVQACIFIEQDMVDYVSFTLDQAFGQHHHFTVVMDYDAMNKNFLSSPLSQIKLIGKALTIEIKQNVQGDSYQFKGLVTHTANEGSEGKHGRLIIEGYSPTILLERGKRWDVFDNMGLREVVEEVADGERSHPKHLDLIVDPEYQTPVTFLMQYNESDWEFLQRLSAITGERLYYTGLELIFGRQPKEFPLREAMYDREITGIRFHTRYLPNMFTRYQYLSELNDTLDQESPKNIENANEHIDEVYRRSEIFTNNRPVRTPLNIPVDDRGALNQIVMQERVATAAQTVYISGETKSSRLRIGRIVTIKLPKGMSEFEDLGTYRIVKVHHEIDEKGCYKGRFEAVAASLKHTPAPELKVPAAGHVSAVVVSNNDPKGMGRVWVDFPFARERRNEVWLRVMTPDAGSSDEVAKNRGMVFIPEKGDQVMVGFEFGDPNRPYVMGSLFHGKNAAGGGQDNNIRSIITKSGHTIEFDDSDGSLGITIKDKNGNIIRLDTQGKSIEISAPESIRLSANDISISAQSNVEIHAGDTMEAFAEKNIDIRSSGELSISATENIAIDAQKEITVTAEEEIKESGKKITFEATDDEMNLGAQGKIVLNSGDRIDLVQS
ncbi:MAG: phage baseplate assembly protein V [Prevotellaceae bacterium]|jgi:uncharacterized protein involved in type VI secretion and phage assembly|nr:phage baseplate assembly protein V [Prevotellaceae bacterium]